MRRAFQKLAEIVKTGAGLYVELAESALQLLPGRR
jgi:hypothetical protein